MGTSAGTSRRRSRRHAATSGRRTWLDRNSTSTSVRNHQPPGRFGALELSGNAVTNFSEKPAGDGASINGGFFVLSPKVIDYVKGDDTVWEREPMERLAREGQLSAFHHLGFWQAMDTLRDKNQLEAMWGEGHPPWRVW